MGSSWWHRQDFLMKVVPHEGMAWPSGVAVPDGWWVDGGRLVRAGTAAWSAPAVQAGQSADELLAQAKAAGWRPGGNYTAGGVYDAGHNLVCGECTPCRNGSRAECIQKNSPVAAGYARQRARRHENNTVGHEVSVAMQQPSGYSPVMSPGEAAQRDAKRAELLAMAEALL